MLSVRTMVYSCHCNGIGVSMLRWRWTRWLWFRSWTSTIPVRIQIFEFLRTGGSRLVRRRRFWCTFFGNAFIIVHRFITTWCICCIVDDGNFRRMTKSIYMHIVSLITIHTVFTCWPRIHFKNVPCDDSDFFFFVFSKMHKLNANRLQRMEMFRNIYEWQLTVYFVLYYVSSSIGDCTNVDRNRYRRKKKQFAGYLVSVCTYIGAPSFAPFKNVMSIMPIRSTVDFSSTHTTNFRIIAKKSFIHSFD